MKKKVLAVLLAGAMALAMGACGQGSGTETSETAGGEDAPYLWVKAPDGLSSWKFFEKLLYEAQVVTTPGVGFGPNGEGYLRLTAFGKKERIQEAMQRLCQCL